MSSKRRKQEESGKGCSEQKQRSSMLSTRVTEHELSTLKNVIYGYLGFLRNISEPRAVETQVRLQAVYDRLPEHLEASDILYFPYEELIAILEAMIGFKLLLVTVFPPTAHAGAALAEVEQLYQNLINAQSLPLN